MSQFTKTGVNTQSSYMKKKTKEVKMDIFDRALNVFQKVIERIENKDISIGSWIVTFFAIVFIRDFLETISSQH